MGEWAKKVGEMGEDVVGSFFDLIGWTDSPRGFDIPCIKPSEHGENEKLRKTHGIDALFTYSSPLANRTLNHLVCSVKYSSNPYPASPSAKFKEYFNELAYSLECFRNSENRRLAGRQFSGIDTANDIGVLFWLTNDAGSQDDMISKIASVRISEDARYGTIYVVDNRRVGFIYDTLTTLRSMDGFTVSFHYQNTGRNYDQSSRESSGATLPVEFINANILILVARRASGEKTFVVSCIDGFHQDRLKRLIGLAQDLTSDLAADTLILFPDYNQLEHDNQVKEAKSGFINKEFTKKLRIASYRSDFRRIAHE